MTNRDAIVSALDALRLHKLRSALTMLGIIIGVGAVIAMGKSLKQRVVAEGIETRQQLAFLQSHRCVEGQGFFFSHPVAPEELAALLVAGRHKSGALHDAMAMRQA